MDFPGVVYEELGGEAEVWPGVWVIPTPGHTAGHQSLVVRQADGTVLLAAKRTTSPRSSRRPSSRGGRRWRVAQPLPNYRRWVDRLMEFDPRRVLFAHDCSVWEPS